MVAPLSMPRDAVGVCLLGDRLYAVGGYDGQTYLNTMESYDPQTNEWTQVTLLWTQLLEVKQNLFKLQLVENYYPNCNLSCRTTSKSLIQSYIVKDARDEEFYILSSHACNTIINLYS